MITLPTGMCCFRLLQVKINRSDAGFMGLIVLITIVGQYFLAYRLYSYFKSKAT